ncbi:hypothetical protein D3C72_1311490 [compost metagenome]
MLAGLHVDRQGRHGRGGGEGHYLRLLHRREVLAYRRVGEEGDQQRVDHEAEDEDGGDIDHEQLEHQGQHVEAIGADGIGHQAEDPDGGNQHHLVDHPDEGVHQGVEAIHQRLGTLAGLLGQRDAEEHAEHQDLQDVRLVQGTEHIGRDHPKQGSHGVRQGALVGVITGEHGGRGAEIDPDTGLEDLTHHQCQQHRQGGGTEEEGERGHPYLARGRAGAQIGGPGQDGDRHQRDHQHLDQLDEERTQGGEDGRLLTHEGTHQRPQDHGNHDLEADIFN